MILNPLQRLLQGFFFSRLSLKVISHRFGKKIQSCHNHQ
ncbi:hypothetical protein NC99_31480 [Sunxiuqinia dokdonensis]|uniref:Uncharacterized protein n=1 Tax=Sunxiuqinia dokdonensis TaxID=1409788 RepID=A0A0L8V6R6_9BACT|nr:hypothetical protein NC99_31480 [Sunxiuqinia dokdonensis]